MLFHLRLLLCARTSPQRRPLARLQWDPGEWFWRDPFSSPDSPGTFFFLVQCEVGETHSDSKDWRDPGSSRALAKTGPLWRVPLRLLGSPLEQPEGETYHYVSLACCSQRDGSGGLVGL